MSDYLLEIGTEELPANQVPALQARLKAQMAETLLKNNLPYEEIITYGTPRRIACIVKRLADKQSTTTKKVKGPPFQSSFDKDSKALPAATGFAQKQGIALDELDKEELGGIVYLVANLTIKGKSTHELLSNFIPDIIGQISGDRPMRWGNSDFKFSRPIRWLVSLLDENEIKIKVNDVHSSNESHGHRILKPGKLKIKSPKTYTEDLRNVCVLVCPQERKDVIVKLAGEALSTVSGNLRKLNSDLLDEVVNLTEWPAAILGEFEKEYLDLPDVLIETVMIHHQRYFPVESSSSKKLLPYFVSIANNDQKNARLAIKQGNERVLKARLADGRFFYFDDQKKKLSLYKDALSQLTFHEGLGSYVEKQDRLISATKELAKTIDLGSIISDLEQTLKLCKLDLVTNLVRELPELQGYVGSWYAKQEGQKETVADAIVSHYAPRFSGDSLPEDDLGCLVSVLDKLDNLVSLFALGKKPTGSSDPYILRRQAQGLIDILMESNSQYLHGVNITFLTTVFLDLLKPKLSTIKKLSDGQIIQKGIADLKDFLLQRVKIKLQDKGFKKEIIEAVMSIGDPLSDLYDVMTRCACLEEFIQTKNGLDLVKVGVRIGNILTPQSPTKVFPDKFLDQAEKVLWETYKQNIDLAKYNHGRKLKGKEEYLKLLTSLIAIVPSVDNFFASVMVNDPDLEKRNNRHALLNQIDFSFKLCADFSKLQPLTL